MPSGLSGDVVATRAWSPDVSTISPPEAPNGSKEEDEGRRSGVHLLFFCSPLPLHPFLLLHYYQSLG
ncbi:hypothetical protein AWENTII_001335 [Aspergillus wentii]